MRQTRFISLLFMLLALMPRATAAEPPASASGAETVQDVIPFTMGNLRGHQMLYNEGWYVVTSSSRAFEYARQHSLTSSRIALEQAAADAMRQSGEYAARLGKDGQAAVQTGTDLVSEGTRMSGEVLAGTHRLGKSQLAYADRNFRKAMDAFVTGNLTIAKRTEAERKELASLPGDYFQDLRSDFSNIYDLASQARRKFSGRIEPAWEASFERAAREFRTEYDRSGNEPNSLMALSPILSGYLKAFYYGLAKPASKTIVKTTVAGVNYAVFLPVTSTVVVTGRTVQAVGLTLYYTGKTGVKMISPTIEGGLLGGMSLLSLSTVPVTYAAGSALGAVNQVAFSTVGPAAGAAQGAAAATAHTAGYVGLLTYDAVKGTTQVFINQAASGIVLGYNALTAVPTHALMGAMDAAVFLAWDGPRLVIAVAQGRLQTGGSEATPQQAEKDHSLGDLPVGTVVDLNKLQKAGGVKVEILSTDSEVIRNVLEKIPADARVEP